MRLVLVDDHPIVLAGLDRLFAEMPDVEVVGRCETGRAALEAARTIRPDLILLDLKLPDMSGIEVLKAIRAERLPVRVVLISAAAMADELAAARELADGFLYKDLSPADLVAARSTLTGEHLAAFVGAPAKAALAGREVLEIRRSGDPVTLLHSLPHLRRFRVPRSLPKRVRNAAPVGTIRPPRRARAAIAARSLATDRLRS